ncbi:MAG: MFS transporter [Acidimicrobiia bacterium]|nr:MFS transporter [Acidimicrobiia bacterium]
MTRSGFPGRGMFGRLAIDLTPLRESRDFRLLWLGELVSSAGSQVSVVAVWVQVYALTHSVAALGLVGIVRLVPLALTALVGGPLIDTHDRRRVLLLAEFGQVASSSVLLIGALIGEPPVALVLVGAALAAGCGGLAASTRTAITPNVVTRKQLPSTLALNQLMFNSTMIIGPAIGGLVIDGLGLSVAYAIDVVSFLAAIFTCYLIRPQIPTRDHVADEVRGGYVANGWAQLTEGLRFLRGQRVLQSTFYVDLIAMIFGMPRALFTVLAVTQFGATRGSEGSVVGLLFSAVAVGAVVAALTTGWVRHIRRQGLAVLWAVAIWGLGIVLFGLSGGVLAFALASLALAGAADVVSAVFRGSILQSTVPDNLRGRMSSVHILVVVGGPQVGDVEATLVASVFSPVASVVIGGAACIVGVALLALAVPEFARYRTPIVSEATG